MDDETDSAPFPGEHAATTMIRKKTSLERWRSELDRCYNGSPEDPVAIGLQKVVREFSLSKEYLEEILKGMEMDIAGTSYATFSELKLYCYRVASAVGLSSMEIFGRRSEEDREGAIQLGIALQLTNILRDIFSDLKSDRIYLPDEDFQRFSCRPEDLRDRYPSPPLIELVRFEIDRAKEFYRQAGLNLDKTKSTGSLVIRVIKETYWELLMKIERNIPELSKREISLSLGLKLGVATQAWFHYRLKAGS